MHILLLPQVSVDSPQNGFWDYRRMSASVFGHFETPASVEDSLVKTQQLCLLLHSQCFLLGTGQPLSGIWPHPETGGKALVGQQVLMGGLLLFQDLMKAKDVSLTWGEWKQIDPIQRDFYRENMLKDYGNTVLPSKCCDFACFWLCVICERFASI